MGLYKRKDSNVWWYRFTVEGKGYRSSTGTDNKQDTEAFEIDRKRKVTREGRDTFTEEELKQINKYFSEDSLDPEILDPISLSVSIPVFGVVTFALCLVNT